MEPIVCVMGYGSVNLATESVSMTVQRLEAPFVRRSGIDTGRRNFNKRFWQAASATPTEKGFWSEQITHPESTILFLQATRTRRGVAIAQGTIPIRLRKDAPLITIRLALPTNNITVLGDSIEVFRAHADVLTPQELDVLGMRVPRGYAAAYFSREEVDELYTVKEISKESKPRPTFAAIATADGVAVVAVAKKQGRIPRRVR